MTDDLLAQLEAVANSGYQPFTVGDITVPLRPVSISESLRVVRRFPPMKAALFGVIEDLKTKGEAAIADLDVTSLLSVVLDSGPEALAAFIAVAAGKAGDVRSEAAFAALPDDYLFPLAIEVKDRTMPEGLELFFAKFAAMAMAEKGRKPAAGNAQKRVRRAA